MTSGRGQRFRFDVTYFACAIGVSCDRRKLLLVGVEAVERRLGRHGLRSGPDRVERLLRDCGVLDTDDLPREVRGLDERSRDAEHLTHRPGEHADPDEIQLLDLLEHLVRDPLLEDLRLEGVAVDQQRGQERLEALDPDGVEGAGADPRHVDLAGLHVLERAGLVQWLAQPPSLLERDLERSVGEPAHLIGEDGHLLLPAARGRHCQHVGVGFVRAACFVAVRAAARGQADRGCRKDSRERPRDESPRLHRPAPPFVGADDATTALLCAHRGAPSTSCSQAWGQPSCCARGSAADSSRTL